MAAPYKVEIDGTEHKFPYLTPQDRIGFTKEGFDLSRSSLLRSFDDSGIDADAKQERLEEFDSHEGLGSNLVRFVQSEFGALKIIQTSVAKLNGKAAANVDALSSDELKAIAWNVCGFPDLEDAKAEAEKIKEGGDDDADPSQWERPETGT